jgi:hypothetical protein
MHQERADFPFLAVNIVDSTTGKVPSWVKTSAANAPVNPAVEGRIVGS